MKTEQQIREALAAYDEVIGATDHTTPQMCQFTMQTIREVLAWVLCVPPAAAEPPIDDTVRQVRLIHQMQNTKTENN